MVTRYFVIYMLANYFENYFRCTELYRKEGRQFVWHLFVPTYDSYHHLGTIVLNECNG